MEGKFRQREQTEPREAKGKGSRLTEGRFRQREQTDRGKVQAKGAD